jgi:hypothetical protein
LCDILSAKLPPKLEDVEGRPATRLLLLLENCRGPPEEDGAVGRKAGRARPALLKGAVAIRHPSWMLLRQLREELLLPGHMCGTFAPSLTIAYKLGQQPP